MNPADIGKLITSLDEKRDAIHVPVIPAICGYGEKLQPGQLVEIDGSESQVYHTVIPYSYLHKAVGIVDPFLENPVTQGDMFWVLIIPGKVKNLTHSWEHADLPELNKKDEDDDYYNSCKGCW